MLLNPLLALSICKHKHKDTQRGFLDQNASTSEPVENGSGTGVIFKKDSDMPILLRIIMLLKEQKK